MSMFEAYSVAVRVRLIDGLTTGMLGWARQWSHLHGQASAFHHQLERIKMTALTGLGLTAIGAAGLMALREPTEQAIRYEQALARLAALGNSAATNRAAQSFSENMDVRGVSRMENLQVMTDAMMITRSNLHEAEMIAPRIARVQSTLAALYGEGGRQVDRQLMDLMRSAEFRGGLASPAAMERELNTMMRFITASGNRVTPRDMVQFMKTGGVAAGRLESGGALLALEPLIQEMGGMRLGTALMTLYNRLQNGIGLQGAAGTTLMQYGLLDPTAVELTPEGRFRRVRPGRHALIEADLEQSDFTRWLTEVAIPTIRAHGGTDADMARIGVMMGGRTGGQIINAMVRAPELAAQARAAGLRAMNIDQAYNLAQTTTVGTENELHRQFHNLMLDLGRAVLPLAVAGLRALIPIVRSIADFVHANPTGTRVIVSLFAALSGLAVLGGAMMLLSSAFSAIGVAVAILGPPIAVVGGIFSSTAVFMAAVVASIGLAVVALYNHWQPFRNFVDGFVKLIQDAGHALGQAVGAVWHVIGPILNGIGNTVRGAVNWVFTSETHPGVANDNRRPMVPRGAAAHGATPVQINIDGRRVAHAIVPHVANAAAGPSTGTSAANGRIQAAPTAASVRR